MSGCTLSFDSGTILVKGDSDSIAEISSLLKNDTRVGEYRTQAYQYAAIMRKLYSAGIPVTDHAKDYSSMSELVLHTDFSPMPHQVEAMKAWKQEKCRGVVVLPTGSGKTFFAVLAINMLKRPTLVVVPTIDLMQQWASTLEKFFQCKVGMLGGGSKEILPITVSTYDSAVLQMEFIGNKFGFAVYDECHHLPGQVNRTAASMCIAPYRLGLTATPERDDDGESVMRELIGDVVFYAHIDELEGNVLQPYRTIRIPVELSPEEEAEYTEARQKYVSFLRFCNIDFQKPDAWTNFIMQCARSPHGREIMNAYQRQRAISRCSRAKMEMVWKIIRNHPQSRIIIFTADNDTAYQIGEAFCLPVLTHKTKASERKYFLEEFRAGHFAVLVTSKVLNEGVDVPEASVGIVVSGSGSTREHIQRLGRILRKSDGKQALLFELVSAGTGEMNVSERRRNNRAYQRNGGYGGNTYSGKDFRHADS